MARIVSACFALAIAGTVSSAEAQRATQVLSAASSGTIVDGCRKHAEGLNKSQAIAVYDLVHEGTPFGNEYLLALIGTARKLL